MHNTATNCLFFLRINDKNFINLKRCVLRPVFGLCLVIVVLAEAVKRGVFSMLLYSAEGDTYQQYFPLWSMLNAIATRANSVLLYSRHRDGTPRQKFCNCLILKVNTPPYEKLRFDFN